MTIDDNRRDLERHAQDFAARAGFTYTVLDPESRAVIGCVYIYPDEDDGHAAAVTSWVRASHAELDIALRTWSRAGWTVGVAVRARRVRGRASKRIDGSAPARSARRAVAYALPG